MSEFQSESASAPHGFPAVPIPPPSISLLLPSCFLGREPPLPGSCGGRKYRRTHFVALSLAGYSCPVSHILSRGAPWMWTPALRALSLHRTRRFCANPGLHTGGRDGVSRTVLPKRHHRTWGCPPHRLLLTSAANKGLTTGRRVTVSHRFPRCTLALLAWATSAAVTLRESQGASTRPLLVVSLPPAWCSLSLFIMCVVSSCSGGAVSWVGDVS